MAGEHTHGGHTGGLSGTHGGVGVLIGEHPLNSDDIGHMSIHPVVHHVADRQESTLQRITGRCTDDVDVECGDLPAPSTLNHRQTAAGQARVDSHYPHDHPFAASVYEQLFDSVAAAGVNGRQ